LLFSSGNPGATYLAQGLLRGHPDAIAAVSIGGVGARLRQVSEVVLALAEVGLSVAARRAPVEETPYDSIDVGITPCLPA